MRDAIDHAPVFAEPLLAAVVVVWVILMVIAVVVAVIREWGRNR